MSNNVCRDCKDRQLYCHATCEKYLAFRKELDERNEAIRDAKAKDEALNGYQIRSAERHKKRLGHKFSCNK